MKKKPVVIGIGELLWDLLPSGKKAGGAPVNFVYHAAFFDTEAYAVSAVGNDSLGDEIVEELIKNRINGIVKRVDHPTGTVEVELENGIPDYTITENVAWDFIPLTDEMVALAKRADAICFGTLAQRSLMSRDTIRKLLSVNPKESLRVFDINIRQHFYSKELIEESLELCNVLKINDEELMLVKNMFNLNHLSESDFCKEIISEYNLKYLILTAGADYSTIYTHESYSHLKTPKVKVADTVGAGDSFTGAFISSILYGKSLAESHPIAVERAAFVCTRAGGWV